MKPYEKAMRGRSRHNPANRLVYSVLFWYWTSMLSWSVMVNSHLWNQRIRWLVVRDHIAGSGLGVIEVTLNKCWFSIVSRAQVRLTCCNQGWAVRKPVNAYPGLKVNRGIIPFVYKCFFTAFVLCSLRLLKLKTEGQTIYGKPHCKVTIINKKSGLSRVSFYNGALTTLPRSSTLGLAKCVYYL